mmetsp:Transcript_5917/g.17532  ORF Transcript_5917/g.17532 Transcript_5917/m.17532 type:complete len:385 (+) Transcript_5917:339-1493(+)
MRGFRRLAKGRRAPRSRCSPLRARPTGGRQSARPARYPEKNCEESTSSASLETCRTRRSSPPKPAQPVGRARGGRSPGDAIGVCRRATPSLACPASSCIDAGASCSRGPLSACGSEERPSVGCHGKPCSPGGVRPSSDSACSRVPRSSAAARDARLAASRMSARAAISDSAARSERGAAGEAAAEAREGKPGLVCCVSPDSCVSSVWHGAPGCCRIGLFSSSERAATASARGPPGVSSMVSSAGGTTPAGRSIADRCAAVVDLAAAFAAAFAAAAAAAGFSWRSSKRPRVGESRCQACGSPALLHSLGGIMQAFQGRSAGGPRAREPLYAPESRLCRRVPRVWACAPEACTALPSVWTLSAVECGGHRRPRFRSVSAVCGCPAP